MKSKKQKNEDLKDTEKVAENFADSAESNKKSDKKSKKDSKKSEPEIVNFSNGKQAIIDKIMNDAKANEKAILDESNKKVDEINCGIEKLVADLTEKSKIEQETLEHDIITRSKTVAELDSKKLILNAKNKLIDETFNKALDQILNLPKAKYEKLILGMLEFAEDGDIVTISKKEKSILTKEKIKAFATKKKINLTLAKDFGDFEGGIILSSKGIDKNLTFESEISILREDIEENIAKQLFAEAE